MSEEPKSWENVIESMHQDVIEGLKESNPGTPEWEFCMRSLTAYETWYLSRKNEEVGFKLHDIGKD
jgi:hypothetical protein